MVIRPHGLRGSVKVSLHNPRSDSLRGDREVTLLLPDGERRAVSIASMSTAGDQVHLGLEGVVDRDGAERLRGARILVSREDLLPLQEGEYYYQDLIGCQVVDDHQRAIGEVVAVFEAGASDVLVVRQGNEERYIPLVDPWVTSVDPTERRIVVSGADQWECWSV